MSADAARTSRKFLSWAMTAVLCAGLVSVAQAQRPTVGGRPAAVPASQARPPAVLVLVERANLPPRTPPPMGARIAFPDETSGGRQSVEKFTATYFTTPAVARAPLVLLFDYCSVAAPTALHSIPVRLETAPNGYHAVDVPIPPEGSPVLHWRATLVLRGRPLQKLTSADWPEGMR